MPDLLHFDLVSPERLLQSGEVFMVVVPGTEGDFGVLAGHAPLVSTIRPGAIAVYPTGFGDSPERIFVDGGFAEVGPAGLTVLADRAVPVADLDVEAAARDLAAAREAAKGATGDALTAAEATVSRLEAMQAVAVN